MAIYYTGTLVGNQINFTTGSASIVAADLKQYVIDQTVSGGQTGLTPSTKATFDFTTGVSGYFSGQDYNLRVATGVISNFTGTLGSAAFRDISATVAENGTGVSTSDSVWDFGTGLSGYLSINAGNLYQVNASSPTANTANINLTGRVSGQVFNDFVQVVAGTGLELSVATDAITISHKDTSSVADVTVAAAAGSAITGVVFTFDPFGHVLSATGQTAVIVRDQIASGATTTAPSEGSVHTLSGLLRTLINESYARNLQDVTNSGNSTTNGINIGGDLVASGNVTLGSDASDTLTVNAGPVVFLNSVQSSDAVVFGPNDATKVSAYKSDTNLLRLDGSLVITGNLTVSGTTTYINTTETNIGDALITLNADFTGAVPTENAGIEIERGTQANTALRWNEGLDRWQFTNDGTTYYNMPITSEFTVYDLAVAAGGTNDAIIRITGSNGDANDITISGSSGVLVTDNGSNLIVVSHEDTSAAVSTVSTNTSGVVIQNFTGLVDTYGHVTGLGVQTTNLDVLYPRTGQVTLDYVTDNNAQTTNNIIVGGLTVGSVTDPSNHFRLLCSTTNDTTTEMFLNAASGRITLQNSAAASFKGTITAFDVANSTAAAWSYDCLVANKSGNTALVSNAIVTKFASENSVPWEVFIDGDNTNDSLKIQVKGEAAKTIKWTASVISAVVLSDVQQGGGD
jgi:hypothetical protein